MTSRVCRFAMVVAPIVLAVPLAADARGFQVAASDLGVAWRVGLLVSLLLLACSAVETYVAQHRIPPDLRVVGEAFVNAFVQPLVDPGSSVAPIRARLRFVPRVGHLEILIAPNAGRTYPNLADHKTNVEYDVDRVARGLQRHLVVAAGVRAEGPWVVVPIRVIDMQEAGAK